MRRGENADRNASEIASPSPRPLPDRARALAGDVAERAAERAEAAPPGFERDVGDRPIGVAEQRGGALDAAREQIAVRREAECLFERAREVRLRYAADFRKASHGPFLVRGAVHAVLRAQQAAQQLGVLAHARMLAYRASEIEHGLARRFNRRTERSERQPHLLVHFGRLHIRLAGYELREVVREDFLWMDHVLRVLANLLEESCHVSHAHDARRIARRLHHEQAEL